jgi:ABC-2 type transport system ATP-binding protein
VVRVILNDVGVEFPITPISSRSIRNVVVKTASKIGGIIIKGDEDGGRIEALSHINFTLEKGDRLALIGPNGAGKTTLIRTLAGIYEPTHGRRYVEGSLVPMFDIGLGLDEEATGYENILIRGLILGMSASHIHEKAASIAEYSELGDYLNMPMRTYSEGMKLRLVFAIATAVEGDIVLMDEWIAVGDTNFKRKTQERLHSKTFSSGIVILASHDTALLRDICNLGLYLEKGKMKCFGPIDEVLDMFAKDMAAPEPVAAE